jgi:hypothetical protein
VTLCSLIGDNVTLYSLIGDTVTMYSLIGDTVTLCSLISDTMTPCNLIGDAVTLCSLVICVKFSKKHGSSSLWEPSDSKSGLHVLKHWYPTTKLQGTTSHKTAAFTAYPSCQQQLSLV